MIRGQELDGITHDTELENYVPELVPGTVEYDETVLEASRQVNELDFYNNFSEATEEIREATEAFFDELHNTLYLLDNGREEKAAEHLEEAGENYESLEEAYEEFLELEAETGVAQELNDYLMDLQEGLYSVEELVPEVQKPSAHAGEPRKAS
ncbi:hypothetical protein [Candidatus Nanohalovita haloferacivicina]|uniref:hypothetical protein n=1 Tax=Candidatus Nanohalovita haloferacivicina TaxID=2978046 RepID=UPI00325F995B|nr:hypothetical protein HBNXNv_0646 [Candidatus Nanohalobia archaeon BNXNv]